MTTVPTSEMNYVGHISIGREGEHQIKSKAETPEAAVELFGESKRHLLRVDDEKTAVCIDARCARCTAQDLISENGVLTVPTEVVKPPVKPKLEGGLFHHATMMAIAGNASLIAGATNYNEAKAIVSEHLTKLGYYDSIHTSINAYLNENGTECGAIDRAVPSALAALDEDNIHTIQGKVGGIAETLAILNGADDTMEFIVNNVHYRKICSSIEQKLGSKDSLYFEGYNPVENRDAMMKSSPGNVELLESDPNHPTHLHEEQGILINMVEGTTIDRDENGGLVFVYDRWMNNKIARLLSRKPEEEETLIMAGDYITLAVANQLVAPGMPVGLLTAA